MANVDYFVRKISTNRNCATNFNGHREKHLFSAVKLNFYMHRISLMSRFVCAPRYAERGAALLPTNVARFQFLNLLS